MTNIDLRFNGYANFKQVAGQLAQLEGQFASLNAQMDKAAFGKGGANFAEHQKQAQAMQRMYGDSLAASRQFDVQQQRINSHTQDYIKNLQRQKEGVGSLARNFRSLANGTNAAYKEQLRLRKMSVSSFTTDSYGNPLATIAVPKNVDKDLDTVRNRLGMIGHATNSASTQMINWGKNTQWAGRQLTVGFTMPLLAFGALAAKTAYDVDKNLTRIAKVYDTTVNQNASVFEQAAQKEHQLNQLRSDGLNTAKNLAMQYGASVKDTLDVQAQLAATGIKGPQLQSATVQAQELAILGEMDYQKAVKATISLQSIYQMNTRELAEAKGYMNAVENATSLSMEDFADAIPIASGPLKTLGADVKDVGFLLTAMKERGVGAVEGADALKSGLIRLYRPSKQIRAEFESLTGKTLPDLTEQSKGELIPLLKLIGEAVKDLEPAERTKALGGLFGAYQVSRLGSLLEGIEMADRGVGQAAKALDVANNSAAENAEMARMEMEKMANSASGRFSRALETFKANMVSTGTEFLSMGAKVISGGSKILEFFAGLPGPMKTMLKFAIITAAIAGPIIMLAGLFGNLIGQGVKLGAGLLLMTTRFKLFQTHQVAAAKVADFAAKGLGREAQAAQSTANQLKSVSIALREVIALNGDMARSTQYAQAVASGRTGASGKPFVPLHVLQGRSSEKGAKVNVGTDYKAQAQADKDRLKSAEGIAKFSGVAAASTAAMAISWGASLNSSSGTAQNISSMAMAFAMLLPVAEYAPRALEAMKGKAGAVSELYKKGGSHLAGWKNLLKIGLMSLTGIGLAVAAVGAGLFMWYKHLKRGRDEMNKIHEDATGLGKVFGFAPRENVVRDDKGNVKASDSRFVEKLNKEYPRLASYIRSANTEQEKFNRAAAQGFKAYNAGATAEQAETVTRTALIAAGKTAKEADALMLKFAFDPTQVAQQVINVGNLVRSVSNKERSFFEKMNPWSDVKAGVGAQAGKEAGGIVNQLIAEGDVKQAQQRLQQIIDDFNEARAQIRDPKTRSAMTKSFVTELQNSMGADKGQTKALIEKMMWGTTDNSQRKGSDNAAINRLGTQKLTLQQILSTDTHISAEVKKQAKYRYDVAMASKAARDAGESGNKPLQKAISLLTQGKSLTLDQLILLRKQTVGKKGQTAEGMAILSLIQRQSKSAGGLLATTNALTKAEEKRKANNDAIADALGRQEGETDNQMFKRATKELYQTSMTSAWQTVGQMMSADIDRQFQGQLDGMQAAQQNAQQAMQRRHQAASNAMQARQTKANNAMQRSHSRAQQALDDKWKKRKKALNDEEDLRKQMFNAEMNRIERMKEMKNLNTDYKVAVQSGNLDEAAKIRNEGQANTESWALEDADTKAQAAYEKEVARIEELEAKEKASLERRQALQQQHLQAKQQREQQAMQAQQERESAALQKSQAAAMANAQRQVEINKAKLQMQLDADLAHIPRTEGAARAYIDRLITKYQKMGIDLSAMSKQYGTSLHDALTSNIVKNANDIKSKIKWAQLAEKAAGDYVKAIWGKSLKSFLKWIDEPVNTPSAGRDVKGPTDSTPNRTAWNSTRHRGGMIDDSAGSRRGYSVNSAPYAREKMVLAEKGEFMMSRRAVKRIGPDMLDSLNKGYPIGRADITTDNLSHRKPRTGGASMNIGVEANTLGSILNRGTKEVIKQVGKAKEERELAAAAMSGGIQGGKDLKVGAGGWMRPWLRKYGLTQGLHGSGGLDYGVPSGTALYSPAAGRVQASYDIGAQAGRRNSGGYGSYGRLVRTQHGNKSVLFAHMSSRGVKTGQSLNKGSYLGRSGNTGNSYGAHVHMEARSNGGVVDPRALFRSNGVSLRRGGELKYDNTQVNAHKGETMLSKPLTQKMKKAVDVARTDTKRYYRDIKIAVDGDVTPENARRLAMEVKEQLDYEESRY